MAPPAGESAHLPAMHAVMRSLLVRRGVLTADDYRRFIAPSLDDLHEARAVHGMTAACERIERAVRNGETVLIYGDYDVDGVTSIVLLQSVLRSLGADAAHVLPHGLIDGYGLKTEGLERVLAERDGRPVITVDCGINGTQAVARAVDSSIDVSIT